MAAPPTTARSALPTGITLDDGYKTVIAFERDPDISFWEKTVTPPGLDGGDAVETTTMHNVTYRTMAPRKLPTLTDCTCTAAYDPDLFNQVIALINLRGGITIHFPDLSTLDFFGFLRLFEPGDIEEGTQPECTVTITPTNYDPDNNVEAAAVLTSVAGT